MTMVTHTINKRINNFIGDARAFGMIMGLGVGGGLKRVCVC